jgi:anthranilate synthase/aminodeoxychorismate synthase-like glutamine amidotransferase
VIATPNHSGLGGAFFGGGGVYRDRLLFDWGTSGRIIAGAVTVRGAQQWPVARVLVIDNYDSFVYNLVQYLGELGAEPIVHRHDAITLDDMDEIDPDAVLISPGPGRPGDAGLSNDAIRHFGERGVPVLGVCLGLQCIGELYGGRVVRAPHVMHGKTSEIRHDGVGVFAGLPSPLTATRYHSLVVERESVPAVLEVTAESEDGLVMGLRHRDFPIEGVQFHPESILTDAGHDLLRNFLGAMPVGDGPGRG